MMNYYKYLPVSRDDERWGLTVLNAGCTRIGPSNAYPQEGHPADHQFGWQHWRVLQEYQVIYITGGSGVFESASAPQTEIKAGTIIILFPDERHRYKPHSSTGWDEYWVGLKGPVIDQLMAAGYFKREDPCLYIGFNDSLLQLFNGIIEHTKIEQPGYQPLVSGAALHLLGVCQAAVKQLAAGNREEDQIVDRARMLFRANISQAYSPEQAAQELNVGYSWFRKLFKQYTGMSPGQYYLQLKIEKARELLAGSDISVKVISKELNFQSGFYFSRMFKEKTGMSPSDYRQMNQSAR